MTWYLYQGDGRAFWSSIPPCYAPVGWQLMAHKESVVPPTDTDMRQQ